MTARRGPGGGQEGARRGAGGSQEGVKNVNPYAKSASKTRTLKQKVGLEALKTCTLRQKVRQKHVPLCKKSGSRCGPGDIKDTPLGSNKTRALSI